MTLVTNEPKHLPAHAVCPVRVHGDAPPCGHSDTRADGQPSCFLLLTALSRGHWCIKTAHVQCAQLDESRRPRTPTRHHRNQGSTPPAFQRLPCLFLEGYLFCFLSVLVYFVWGENKACSYSSQLEGLFNYHAKLLFL